MADFNLNKMPPADDLNKPISFDDSDVNNPYFFTGRRYNNETGLYYLWSGVELFVDFSKSFLVNVGIYLCGGDINMAEHLLNGCFVGRKQP